MQDGCDPHAELDALESEIQAPRRRWVAAAVLGMVLCALLFLVITWIQPILGGNERIEIPASVRIALQGSRAEREARKKAETSAAERKEEPAAARRSAPRKAAPARTTAVARAEARASSKLEAPRSLIIAPIGLAAGTGSGPSFQMLASAEDAGVIQQMKKLKEHQRRREEAINDPSASRRGARSRAGGSGQGGGIDLNLSGSSSQNYIPQPKYPDKAKKDQVQGFVEVQVLISITGTILKHEITAAQPVGVFEQSVIDVLPQCRFQPALDESGMPIEYWDNFRFNFELKNLGGV